MLTATLIAALAWGAPTLSPVGMAWATQRFAAWAALPFAVAVLAGLVATAWMLARAGRGPSAPLLMSGAALLALTLATGTIAIALAAPGLVDHTWRAVALIAAPWAAMVALAGLALHAWLWSRQIPPGRMGHAVLRWALRAGTLGALAAAGWLALQPRASLEHIAATTVGPTEKAVADRAERVGVIVLGAERIAHALARTPTPKSPPPP